MNCGVAIRLDAAEVHFKETIEFVFGDPKMIKRRPSSGARNDLNSMVNREPIFSRLNLHHFGNAYFSNE
jgi:hypothetical protein